MDMGGWKHDVHVMDSLSDLLRNQKDDLMRFLNAIGSHNDGTPMFAFLLIYGIMVERYCFHSQTHTETESFDLALGEIANHPTVSNMVASMMQKKLDGGLGIDR